MQVQAYLKLTAIITFLFGIGLILLSSEVFSAFGGQVDPASSLFIQFLGSTLFGYSVLNWQGAKSADPWVLHTVVRANIATLSVATLLSIAGQSVGAINQFGYLLLLVHLAFAIGFIACELSLRRA